MSDKIIVVNEEFSCPDCCESNIDNLIINENDEKVFCATCGCIYFIL